MRKALITFALVSVTPASALAESFTFESRNDIVNRLVAPVAGSKTIVAQFSSGGITATYSNRKVVSKSNCATWPAPPGGMFTTSGACMATDTDGSRYTVVVSCRIVDEKGGLSDCFGQLTGVAGVYQGKTGTVSWRSTSAADFKSSTATGTGMWN
ncbi:MAG: hypothetical protein HOP13_01605 [Alphaproteobacteria bacterium]|jgi:hypothetical protein|nr:hypothetical protein [Alphaproteobacteria bacterium]